MLLLLVLLLPHYFIQVNAHQVPKHRSTKKKMMKVSKKFTFPSVCYSEEPLELRIQLKHQSSDFCNRTKMFVPLMFPMKSSVVLADGGCGPIFWRLLHLTMKSTSKEYCLHASHEILCLPDCFGDGSRK